MESALSARRLVILGSPRSGTTWLGKIFDSHPDVLYRHEPDTICRNGDIPFLPEAEAVAAAVPAFAAYLTELLRVRHPKVTAQAPFFAKKFRPTWASIPHRILARAAQGSAWAAERSSGVPVLSVPDMVAQGRAPEVVVMKSVSSLGRASLFLEADPTLRLIHIARHPCGQIASRLRGCRQALLDAHTFVGSLARTRLATRLGLDEPRMASLSIEGQMACQWTIANTMVHEALVGHPRYRFVAYEGLSASPEAAARAIFEWAGLSWSAQTEEFLHLSTAGSGRERYFGVVRDSRREIGKWQKELSQTQVDDILAIARLTAFGRSIVDRANLTTDMPFGRKGPGS